MEFHLGFCASEGARERNKRLLRNARQFFSRRSACRSSARCLEWLGIFTPSLCRARARETSESEVEQSGAINPSSPQLIMKIISFKYRPDFGRRTEKVKYRRIHIEASRRVNKKPISSSFGYEFETRGRTVVMIRL